MRDEKWRDRPDTKNLSDGGFEVGQISSVTELGVTISSDLSVQLFLDLFLNLKQQENATF